MYDLNPVSPFFPAVMFQVCLLQPNDMGFDTASVFDCIPTPFDLDDDLLEEDDNYFTAPFNRSRMDQYVFYFT